MESKELVLSFGELKLFLHWHEEGKGIWVKLEEGR
jgi:hypothetical protein